MFIEEQTINRKFEIKYMKAEKNVMKLSLHITAIYLEIFHSKLKKIIAVISKNR